jgi:hypothetical protein
MDRWHRYWAYIATHASEIGWAAFFGLLFGLIFDLMNPEGRVRTGFRHLKNKLSERSAARLGERIKQLETQRDRYAAYLSSDKALYLATFQIVIGMLVSIAFGAGLEVLSDIVPIRFPGLLAVFCYFLATAIGIQGFKISSLDTREKVTEMVAKLESEIADLKNKLEAITK